MVYIYVLQLGRKQARTQTVAQTPTQYTQNTQAPESTRGLVAYQREPHIPSKTQTAPTKLYRIKTRYPGKLKLFAKDICVSARPVRVCARALFRGFSWKRLRKMRDVSARALLI